MPSVKISEEHDKILEERQDELEEETGVRGTKKSLVEEAIENTYK